MQCSTAAMYAEANARLILSLVQQHEARELGAVSGFFEVSDTWNCPVCHRSKEDIARRDKNRNLYCPLHWHHDHFSDLAADKLPLYRDITRGDARSYDSLRGSFERFPRTLICGDCNAADGAAKTVANAKKDFSFAPFEISTFIIVSPNSGHALDNERVLYAYEKSAAAMSVFGRHLREVVEHQKVGEFEMVGGAALRVLMDLQKRMNEAKS